MECKNIKLGFSTNAFHKTKADLSKCIDIIRNIGCRAIEICFPRLDDFFSKNSVNLTAKIFDGFKYVSFHTPKYNYGDNEGTKKIFEKILEINNLRKLDVVVFHPTDVIDMEIFRKIKFTVAFENMDSRNQLWRTVDEIIPLLNNNADFQLVLDLNHIYSNDATMILADEFYEKLGHKITHLHLSGYKGPGIDDRHVPLFLTKQLGIIRAIQKTGIPIIIESALLPSEAETEYNFILENL